VDELGISEVVDCDPVPEAPGRDMPLVLETEIEVAVASVGMVRLSETGISVVEVVPLCPSEPVWELDVDV
jgi:hypothetical protein